MLVKRTTKFTEQMRTITGLATRCKWGDYGRGCNVSAGTVSTALIAVGQVNSLDTGVHPLKTKGSEKFLHKIQGMLDGWKKEDPPMKKKLPIEVDIPEFLVKLAMSDNIGEGQKAIVGLTPIDFYYLMRVGGYKVQMKAK